MTEMIMSFGAPALCALLMIWTAGSYLFDNDARPAPVYVSTHAAPAQVDLAGCAGGEPSPVQGESFGSPEMATGAENWATLLPAMKRELTDSAEREYAILKEPTSEWSLTEIWDGVGLSVVDDPHLGRLRLGDPEPALLFAETSAAWVEEQPWFAFAVSLLAERELVGAR